MFLEHYLKSRRLRFLDQSVSTSDDEHDFVPIGVQRQCSSQSDTSGTGHEPCHDLSDP